MISVKDIRAAIDNGAKTVPEIATECRAQTTKAKAEVLAALLDGYNSGVIDPSEVEKVKFP